MRRRPVRSVSFLSLSGSSRHAFVESQVGDTPEGRGGTHEMCEVDDSHVVRVVTVRAAVDAPVALIVCLASNPENRLFLQESGGSLRVADEDDEVLRELMSGAPRGWSNWTACPQGCCLSYDGGDKAHYMAPWLKFLMATFLVPGATAEGTDGLSCDHVLSGMVVSSRRDTRELYSITVRDNEVEVELLWPGNPKWSDYPRLAYQTEIDRFGNWVADRKARE
jgi:hypothetical protein